MSDQTKTIDDVVAAFLDEIDARMEAVAPAGPQRVVFQRIQSSANRDAQKALEPFQKLEVKPLALHHCADIVGVRRKLVSEFPYSMAIIDALLKPTFRGVSRGEPWLRFEPTIVVGKPGLGKTRLLRRLCDELGVGCEVMSAAGVADDMFFGVSRGWSTGQPSAVAELVRRAECANPVFIIDEIDKTRQNHNGDFLGKLLPLLERQESTRWRDPFLCGDLDVSCVGWLFTANDVSELPAPFRSRVRVLEMTAPEVQHLPAVVRSIIGDMANEEEIDPRWYPGLDVQEMSAILQSYERHRSVRILREQVRRLVDLREIRMQ